MRFLFVVCFFQIGFLAAQEIQQNILGFATSNTFTYCSLEDTSFISKVCAINPRVLRFPGGAVGNFYHFGKRGYGFDFAEIDKYHSGKFPKRARGLESARKKKDHQHNYIDDFIVLATKTNAKAVLVANPFVQNDDDIIFMIQKLQEHNIDVIGVELGSELSNRSYFLKGYTIDDYILFSKRCSKRIKNKFPQIKTAIVAAPLGKRKGHRHNIWNNKLSALDFYDAIIIHSYAKVIKGKAADGQMISEESEGQNKTEEFEIYKDRIIDYFDSVYVREVQEYVRLYNKPIWVTEWNLQMSKTTGNTLLQSFFVAQYILEILANPSFSSIELTTYHNLGGRDISGSIFRNNNGKIEIHSTYYNMIMIGKIFTNHIVQVKKEQDNEVFLYVCYDKYNKEILRYLLDWQSYEFTCIDSISEPHSSTTYKSSHLFDTADDLGILDLKINKIDK